MPPPPAPAGMAAGQAEVWRLGSNVVQTITAIASRLLDGQGRSDAQVNSSGCGAPCVPTVIFYMRARCMKSDNKAERRDNMKNPDAADQACTPWQRSACASSCGNHAGRRQQGSAGPGARGGAAFRRSPAGAGGPGRRYAGGMRQPKGARRPGGDRRGSHILAGGGRCGGGGSRAGCGLHRLLAFLLMRLRHV